MRSPFSFFLFALYPSDCFNDREVQELQMEKGAAIGGTGVRDCAVGESQLPGT